MTFCRFCRAPVQKVFLFTTYRPADHYQRYGDQVISPDSRDLGSFQVLRQSARTLLVSG